jgi:hypothetical protein
MTHRPTSDLSVCPPASRDRQTGLSWALSLVGLCGGIGLWLTPHPVGATHLGEIQWSGIALAQSSDKVARYARAAYEIERLRQQHYAEAKRILGGNVPGNVCRQQNIPGPVRSICSRFDAESAKIVRRHGLSTGEFDEITLKRSGNAGLEQQISNEIMRIQQGR